jgi:hypothetical protein
LIFEALGITLDENANHQFIEGHPMWQQEFIWFFTIFHQEFRKNNGVAFEVMGMQLSIKRHCNLKRFRLLF